MILTNCVAARGKIALALAVISLCSMISNASNASGPPAVEETPAVLTERDTGKILPVSLFKGHVSSQSSRYILGPGDTLSIRVKDLEKFNQSLSIRPDGYASIHPFGEMYIAGTDIRGLQTWLESEFKTYLLKPEVTINVDTMRPALVYIKGAVQRPGTYQFLRQKLKGAAGTPDGASAGLDPAGLDPAGTEMTLSNVLSRAGGVGMTADIDHIEVFHAATGRRETFTLRDFLSSGGLERDIWLLPGDSVFVPDLKRPMDPATFKLISHSTYFRDKFPVVVLGSVQKQGEVQIDPTNNTLEAAIGLAGGFLQNPDKRAQGRKTTVILQRPDYQGGFSRKTVKRGQSPLELMPGDVLYVQ